MNDLEKYLSGKPLNKEMEALLQGKGEESPLPQVFTGRDLSELDDNDREHLRRLRLEPGWPIFLRLLDKVIKGKEDRVKHSSKVDPLANRDRLAADWAYVGMMEQVRAMAINLIDAEVAKLEQKKARGR